MASKNILTAFPEEIVAGIISYLSNSRLAIKACRLTCHIFHRISTPFLFSSVVLANKLDVLYLSLRIIEHPLFSQCVEELILVEHCEPVDEDKYDLAFHDADWEKMEEEDKMLWQNLSRYSDYLHEGPERFRGVRKTVIDYHKFVWPDFHDYIRSIRSNMLEKLLNTLPNLRRVVLTDFRSAGVAGLSGGTPKSESYMSFDRFRCEAYSEGQDFILLIYLIGRIKGTSIESITVGPHLSEKCMAYRQEHRDKRVFVRAAPAPYRLSLGAIDESWEDDPYVVNSVMRGLRRLQLSIAAFDTASLLETSLPSVVELASPTLTHLALDAEGLIRNGTPRDNLGLLGFEAFFGKLHMPHLVQFDLRGWVYTQDQMQRFLVRHARTLLELRLMHNLMLEGDIVSLANFGCDKLRLVGIELDGGVEEEILWRTWTS